MDHAKRGADALSAGDFATAIKEYTAAIKESALSPDYRIKRSMAYQRSSPPDYVHAVSDAEKAVLLAQKRAKRELIMQAQLRRAIGLYGLERYADAQFILGIVKKMDSKDNSLAMWESKINTKLAELPEGDPKRQVTVKETPERSESAPPATTNGAAATATTTAAAAPAQTPADKIRNDWYQSSDAVTFTLLAKGVPKDKAVVDIQPRSLTISFPIMDHSTYDFSLDPLYAPVDVAASRYNVMSTKIEVVLKKAQPGQKWHALESDESIGEAPTAVPSIPSQILASSAAAQKGPSYPTSSRNGPKNWDKLAQDLTSKKNKKDGEGEKSKDGDDDDDDYDYDAAEGGDDVNNFFQKLYAGADPDTRRAMMKSFSESNGTALSTNWDEVRKQKMETTPPDGMEAKKWGE